MTSKDRIKELQKEVGANPDGSIGNETLSKFAQKYGKTRAQTIHFFAQIHHESGGFSIVRENMNYSAGRIMEIFGVGNHSANVTRSEAQKLAGKPYDLAERVYGLGNPKKAKELGNTRVGDGWLFRGGGALQCTGGFDYQRYGGQDLYDNPDKIGESSYYFTTAIKEFDAKNIWKYAKDLSDQSILDVSRVVNVGRADTTVTPNGMADRRAKVKYYDGLFKAQVEKVIRTTTTVNLRLGAGTNFDSIQTVEKGVEVNILEVKGDWSRVFICTLKKEGWIFSKYLA